MLRAWLTALGLAIAGIAVLVWLVPSAPLTGDGQYYVEFVRNGLQHGASSWHERRLLGPVLVRATPLDPLVAFQILTLVSLTLTALLMWRASESLLAIPLLLGTWVAAPNVREYALVDPVAWVFVAAVWLATVRQRWLWAAALAAIGVFAKEVVVLSAVAAGAAAWQAQKPWRSLIVAAPALAAVFLLTLVFPGSGNDALAYLIKWVRDGLGSLGAPRVLFLVLASYGALWFLLPIGWRSLPSHLQRAGAVFLLAGLVLPFVGSPERMEEAIFPIVIASAVAATRDWLPAAAWTLALGNLLFVARVGGDARIPTLLAWAGLAVAFGVIGLSLLPGRWPSPRSAPQRQPSRPSATAPPPR
ncbi:MAG TPA: hypothetical protein VFG86_19645 [Chloroflexota bacterium]|nr:hypothetical protein [Chloroflexota bacterium]